MEENVFYAERFKSSKDNGAEFYNKERTSMNEVLKSIFNIGIIPVIAIEDAEKAVPLAKALVAGGLPAAEVTFRTAAAERNGMGFAFLQQVFPDSEELFPAFFVVQGGIGEYSHHLGIPVISGSLGQRYSTGRIGQRIPMTVQLQCRVAVQVKHFHKYLFLI